MEKERRIIIALIIIIAFAIFFFAYFVSAQDNEILKVRQFYSISSDNPSLNQLKQFTIVTNKINYIQGDVAFIQDFQDVNTFCKDLKGSIKLTEVSSGLTIATTTTPIVFNAGFMTAFMELSVDTLNLNIGQYRIEARWYCEGNELGQDGRVDAEKEPSVFTINIQQRTTELPPEETCRIRTCNIGQILENLNRADCFCKDNWVEGDNICSIGERATSVDCEPKSSSDCNVGEIYLEDSKLCYPADMLCQQYGGTKSCKDFDSEEEFSSFNTFKLFTILSIGLGIILIIIGGIKWFKNGRK